MRARIPCLLMVVTVAALFLSSCTSGALSMAMPGALRALLSDVSLTPTTISPNADGTDDVTHITYQVGRTSDVSIYFVDSQGKQHFFRQAQRRSPGTYEVYWGGAVNEPMTRQISGGQETVESWVLPDGVYQWVIEAVEVGNGRRDRAEGQITIQNADTKLPDFNNFSVVPKQFSPNQDSIDDRVSVSYYLTKKAERVSVYLEKSQQGTAAASTLRYPITEVPSLTTADPGEVGYHGYQYDGGVDLNAEPPPDGDYIVKAEAEDKVGNRTVVSTTLTIKEGGKPRAEVAGGDIQWQGEMNRVVSVPLSNTLCFTTTIVNIGPVPIRTAGPWPGQLYKFTENNNTLAQRYNDSSWYQQAGSWRFGINFDTTGVDFPFRWAIGRKEDLEERMVNGKPQYYLLPGHRGQVYGCIQFDQKPPVGTQYWWGGLIHEFVAIENDQVNRIEVKVGAP